MPRIKKAATQIEERIRLSSKVTVVVIADAETFDTLHISRIGGSLKVALAGAATPQPYQPAEPYVPPPDTPAIAAAREQLVARHPSGPVTPASLGFPTFTPETLGGVGDFAGPSNEESLV